MAMKQNEVKPRFIKGQKVIIKPVNEKGITRREYSVNEYAGKVGEIANFYYMTPPTGRTFFIYNVRVGRELKEITVYEDELEPVLW
jgi:hypothetical protein